MASPSLKLLIQIQSDLSQLNATIQGLNNLQAATTRLSTGSAAQIGAFSAAFTQAFHAIEEAAKKTAEVLVHFAEGFIEKAAEIQTEEFPLTQMLKDHGDVAKEVLEGINSLWQQVGVISNESMARAARSLLLMNVPADNLIARLIELGKISVATGEDIDQVAGAYQRVRQGIEKDVAPAVRGVGAFGLSTLAIFQAMEEHFGKLRGVARIAEGELIAMIQGGKVSIDDLNKSLRESADEGGRFANVFAEKRATFDGAVQAMKTAWQGLQVELGTPIIDVLTPVIGRITEIIKYLNKVGEDQGWANALRLTWSLVLTELSQLTITAITAILDLIEKIVVASISALGFIAQQAIESHFSKEFFKGLGKLSAQAFDIAFSEILAADLPDKLDAQRSFLFSAFQNIFKNLGGGVGKDLLKLPPETTEETHRAITAKQLSEALHELELAMNAVREEQTLISQAPFMGMDEKRVATIQAVEKEMENLQQTLVKLEQMKDALPLNDAQLAELNVRIQAAQNRFKSLGQQLLGLTQPLKAELQSWANSFGTTAQQIGRTIEQTIGTSLQALNQYLVTGKFNAQQLLQQIITLGLQLVEQMVIQRVMAAINHSAAVTQAAISGKAIAAAYSGAATAVTISTEGQAALTAPGAVASALALIQGMLAVGHEGGPISRRMRRFHGGGLAPDEVPIIAQEGEIMIQRDVAQRPGMAEFLLGINDGFFHSGGRIRRMHEGGVFREPGWYGGFESLGEFGQPFTEPTPLPDPFFGPPSGEITGGQDRSGVFRETAQPLISPWWSPGRWSGFGNLPNQGWSPFGGTILPTDWVNYPGVGFVPRAVPVSQAPWTGYGTPQTWEVHRGGAISRSGIQRMHGGGSVGRSGAAGVNIYAFTDLRALIKHMGSRDGQKIIFDTIKGRRIDLGMK